MSAGTVISAIKSVWGQKITADSFAPVASAVGQNQDAAELAAVKFVQFAMQHSLVEYSRDGFDAVAAQVARGDEVAKKINAETSYLARGAKTLGLSAGMGTVLLLFGAVANPPLMVAGIIACGVGSVLFSIAHDRSRTRATEELPD